MEILVYVGIYACFVLIALGIAAILGFGVRSLQNGKVKPLTAGIVSGPIVLAVLLGLILGDCVKGAILACIVVFVLTLIAVTVNGVRGFIST